MPAHLMADRVKKLACSQCGLAIDPKKFQPFTVTRCGRCQARVRVPAAFDQFELLEMLGKGTSGNVFKAFNPKLQRNVALKILADQGAGASLAEACIAEARALAKLNHPNVVQVYSIGSFRDQHFIAMELVEGGTAQKYLQAGYQLAEVEALEFAIRVTRGLDAAYKQGMVHMDVKPANILITHDTQEPKLIDFGAAQFIATLPAEAKLVGTPYYVAPEVVRGMKPGFKADLYSLGATLFHLFTGRPPFEGKHSIEVIKKRMANEAPSMLTKCDHVHAETAEVIAWMIQSDPDRRYESYGELIEAFEAVRQTVEGDPMERSETFWFDELLDDGVNSQLISTQFNGTWAGHTTDESVELSSLGSIGLNDLDDLAASGSFSNSKVREPEGPAGISQGFLAVVVLAAAALIGLVVILASTSGSDDAVATSNTEEPDDLARLDEKTKDGLPKLSDSPPIKPPASTETIIPTPKSDPMLVAFWPFEQDTKQLSVPMLGSRVRGQLRQAKDGLGEAQRFDGGAYLEASGPSQIAGNSSFSLMMRLKPDNIAKRSAVFELGNGKSRGGFGLTLESQKTARFGIPDGSTLDIPLGPIRDKAKHLAVLYDNSSGALVVFIDSKQVKQQLLPQGLNLDPTGGIRIGRSQNSKLQSYVGTLADVRLYNHAVSISEVRKIASLTPSNAKSKITPVSTSTPKPNPKSKVPVGHGPVATFLFEGGQIDAQSEMKVKMHGKLKLVSDSIRGKVLELDGKSYLECLRSASMNQMHLQQTISFWFKTTPKISHCEALISMHEGSWYLHRHDTKKFLSLDFIRLDDNTKEKKAARVPAANEAAEDAQWHHVAHAYDGKTVRLFFDGRKVAEGVIGGLLANTDQPMLIGHTLAKRGASPFRGRIDEVRIYPRSLKDAEILKLFTPPVVPKAKPGTKVATPTSTPKSSSTPAIALISAEGLVSHLPLDGTLKAKTGDDGRSAGAVFANDADRGDVVSLAGNGQHLALGSTGFKDFTKGMTLAIWIKPTKKQIASRFFDLGSGNGSNAIMFSRWFAEGRIDFRYKHHTLKTKEHVLVENKWQHVAATLGENGQVYLYHNGKVVAEGQFKSMPPVVERKRNLVGNRDLIQTDKTQSFKGFMSDARVYSRPLRMGEVATLAGVAPDARMLAKLETKLTLPKAEKADLRVTSFVLVDGPTNKPIRTLKDFDTVKLRENGRSRVIEAMTDGKVKSVFFSASDGYRNRLENKAAWTYRSNVEQENQYLVLGVGPREIMAVPFDAADAKGKRGVGKIIRLNLVDESGRAKAPPYRWVDPKPDNRWTGWIKKVAPGFTLTGLGYQKPGVKASGIMEYVSYRNRNGVVSTHPIAHDRPSMLERVMDLPTDQKMLLRLGVTHYEKGDFRLVVRVNGQVLEDRLVGPTTTKNGWLDLDVDLSAFAGKKIKIEIENKANDWNGEWAYWSHVQVISN